MTRVLAINTSPLVREFTSPLNSFHPYITNININKLTLFHTSNMDINTLLDFAEELLNMRRQLFCSPHCLIPLAKNLGKNIAAGTANEELII